MGTLGAVEGTPGAIGGMVGLARPNDGFMAAGISLGGLDVAGGSLGAARDPVGLSAPAGGCTDPTGISLDQTGVVIAVHCTQSVAGEPVGLIRLIEVWTDAAGGTVGVAVGLVTIGGKLESIGGIVWLTRAIGYDVTGDNARVRLTVADCTPTRTYGVWRAND